MNVLDHALIATALAAAGWWALSRHRRPQALQRLSAAAALLAAGALVVNGPQWQMVPWQLMGGAAGAAAALRRWRPGHSRRWRRALGRGALGAGTVIGALAGMTALVPALPTPAGPLHVGSEVFRWTDRSRPETLTADPADRRQVVAQAWYPSDATSGAAVPYYEAQDRLPRTLAGLPAFMFSGFARIRTHAIAEAPVSASRPAWPVVVLAPGLAVPREWYTGLCTDLASRGYVVLALSAAYESAVTVLAGGRVAGQRVHPDVMGPPPHPEVQRLIDLRVADIRFALDQLGRLRHHASSPLSGHLDLARTAIVGHSVGGAAAVQAMAEDPRLKAGVNLDGKLFGTEPDARLHRPFLWIESADAKTDEYVHGRDRLMEHLGTQGTLRRLAGSTHMSFSDAPTFWTATGRRLLGGPAAIGSPTTSARAAGAVDRFVRRAVGQRSPACGGSCCTTCTARRSAARRSPPSAVWTARCDTGRPTRHAGSAGTRSGGTSTRAPRPRHWRCSPITWRSAPPSPPSPSSSSPDRSPARRGCPAAAQGRALMSPPRTHGSLQTTTPLPPTGARTTGATPP
jgi:predicted dienelactone hydrolase